MVKGFKRMAGFFERGGLVKFRRGKGFTGEAAGFTKMEYENEGFDGDENEGFNGNKNERVPDGDENEH